MTWLWLSRQDLMEGLSCDQCGEEIEGPAQYGTVLVNLEGVVCCGQACANQWSLEDNHRGLAEGVGRALGKGRGKVTARTPTNYYEAMGLPVQLADQVELNDRFDAQAPTTPGREHRVPDLADIDARRVELEAAGLEVRVGGATILRGGRHYRGVDDEVGSFDAPFLISMEADGSFLVLVESSGYPPEKAITRTLEEAVKVVLVLYAQGPSDRTQDNVRLQVLGQTQEET